jgi:hypothetical protein
LERLEEKVDANADENKETLKNLVDLTHTKIDERVKKIQMDVETKSAERRTLNGCEETEGGHFFEFINR